MRGGIHLRGGWTNNFYAQTFPIAFFYGLFILFLIYFFVLREDHDSNYVGRGALVVALSNMIAEHNLIFRILFACLFGFVPAYALSHGWVDIKYKSWGYGLAVCYAVWIVQKIIRVLFFPEEKTDGL